MRLTAIQAHTQVPLMGRDAQGQLEMAVCLLITASTEQVVAQGYCNLQKFSFHRLFAFRNELYGNSRSTCEGESIEVCRYQSTQGGWARIINNNGRRTRLALNRRRGRWRQ